MTSVLWRSDRPDSSELCELAEIPGGSRLSGHVLVAVDAKPIHLVYELEVDERWRTRTVRVTLFEDGEPRTLAIGADGEGHWTVDGLPDPDLEGCLDVDLEWTPATNTLPIRRLGLIDRRLERGTGADVHPSAEREAGSDREGPAAADTDADASVAISAAWVRFPGLTVERLEQAYERIGPAAFRYSSGQFAAALVVDREGLVLEYEGFWRAIAHSEPDRLEALRGR